MRNSRNIEMAGLSPIGQDSKGLMWSAAGVRASCANDINSGNYFERRTRKNMATDYEKAAEVCDKATKMFNASMDTMLAAETRIAESAKRTSSKIRTAANELHEGLQRVEKTANFDKLERYVGLLERAAQAMSILADLEKDGKLAKIASAVQTK